MVKKRKREVKKSAKRCSSRRCKSNSCSSSLSVSKNNVDVDEHNKRVTDNIRLVYHIINNMRIPKFLRDDAISEGMLALVKASRMFDSSKDIEFSTYAYVSIVRRILKFLRKEVEHISIGYKLHKHYDGIGKTSDYSYDNSNVLWLSVNMFPEPIRKIMIERINHGTSFSEIARNNNISHYEMQKILAYLREELLRE